MAAVAAGFVPSLLVLVRTPGLNGTPYWPWRYADAPLAPALAVTGLAFAATWAVSERFHSTRSARLPLLALSLIHVALTFCLAALANQGLAGIGERVRHPDITSYHTEASRLESVSDWLADYDARLPQMIGHTQTHPPGPVLYYVFWNRLFGPEAGADAGGLFLGLVAGLAIPLVFMAAKRATNDLEGAFSSAILWTPLPSLVLMLGAFDAAYPVLTLGLISLWIPAVWDANLRAAAGFGALLAAALFFAHNFLVLGALFGLLGLAPALAGSDRAAHLRRFVRASAVALSVCVGIFALANIVPGYDHAAALTTSMRIQEGLAGAWNRPWRLTVIWDLYDFFLASGWAPAAAVALFCIRWARGGLAEAPRVRWFALAALGTLAVVDLSGLLRAETARVWLFLQPLALIPAGAEVSRWPAAWRTAFVAVLFFALAVMSSRLVFL